jgi:serine/threonine protein kinase
MPLADSDLNKKISKSKINLSQDKLIKLLKQLINSFCYMQKMGIAHSDIKPGNIFIMNENYFIGDFDQSIKIKLNNNNKIISLNYKRRIWINKDIDFTCIEKLKEVNIIAKINQFEIDGIAIN